MIAADMYYHRARVMARPKPNESRDQSRMGSRSVSTSLEGNSGAATAKKTDWVGVLAIALICTIALAPIGIAILLSRDVSDKTEHVAPEEEVHASSERHLPVEWDFSGPQETVVQSRRGSVASGTSEDDFVLLGDTRESAMSEEDIKGAAAAAKFRSGGTVGSAAVEVYAKTWEQSGGHIDFRLLHPLHVDSMKIRRDIFDHLANKKRPMFLPMILEKGVFNREDHIVCAVINPAGRTIEYFDPKGNSIEGESRKISGLNQTPSELFNMAAHGASRISNTRGIQGKWNGTDCGVFVSKFMEERAQFPFDSVCDQMSTDAGQLRKDMARKIESPPR